MQWKEKSSKGDANRAATAQAVKAVAVTTVAEAWRRGRGEGGGEGDGGGEGEGGSEGEGVARAAAAAAATNRSKLGRHR